MNENNKSFYPSNMFEFIHHPEYGCHDLEGLICHELSYTSFRSLNSFMLVYNLQFLL
jgi:hypothetical protein